MDNPSHATRRVKLIWTDENIQEWNQRHGYVISRIMKNTFEALSQYYPGVQHENEEMHKNLEVVRFTILPDPICSIKHNKENFYVDIAEHVYASKKCWGGGILWF